MDQERLKAELEAKHDAGAVLRRLGGFKQVTSLITGGGVPRPVRGLMEEVFAAPRDSRAHMIASKRGALSERFQTFSDAEWKRLIGTLLPHLAPAAESAIRALALRPYQDGYTRK